MRSLRILVQHLPPTSALHRAMLGHDWTTARDWLAADVVDALRQLLVLTANVHRGENQGQVPPPEPVERPGAKERADAQAAEDEAERAAHERRRAQLLPRR